jgi:hypothetical protein
VRANAATRSMEPKFSSYVYASDEKAKHKEKGEETHAWIRDPAQEVLAEVESHFKNNSHSWGTMHMTQLMGSNAGMLLLGRPWL